MGSEALHCMVTMKELPKNVTLFNDSYYKVLPISKPLSFYDLGYVHLFLC